MKELVRHGVTVVLEVDDERRAENGDYWTLIMSGAALGDEGYIRAEEPVGAGVPPYRAGRTAWA